jgi:hypothetical protein
MLQHKCTTAGEHDRYERQGLPDGRARMRACQARQAIHPFQAEWMPNEETRLNDTPLGPSILPHAEGNVARKRGAGSYHLDFSGSRAARHGGRNKRGKRGRYGEFRGGAVEGDAGCAGQVGTQNVDGGSHGARGWLRLDERARTHVQAEDRSIVVGPAPDRRPVKLSIGGLDQPGERVPRSLKLEPLF